MLSFRHKGALRTGCGAWERHATKGAAPMPFIQSIYAPSSRRHSAKRVPDAAGIIFPNGVPATKQTACRSVRPMPGIGRGGPARAGAGREKTA
jgi:hypothetical protein